MRSATQNPLPAGIPDTVSITRHRVISTVRALLSIDIKIQIGAFRIRQFHMTPAHNKHRQSNNQNTQ